MTHVLQVRALQGGVCTVKYEGPPPIAMGIKVCCRPESIAFPSHWRAVHALRDAVKE
jgi:hypothetical protein